MRELPVTDGEGRAEAPPGRGVGRDLLLAAALALVLSAFWAATDWARLRALVLPDTDDMMRLAQIRDWLAGQGLNDWTQYRAGPPSGLPMHWSRLNDLAPAAIIGALSPLVGRHGAELAAVLAYPALLFCANLFLLARIARRLWSAPAAPVATLLGALAFPGTAIFLPGRIDHHALQTVLVGAAVLALMRGPDRRGGLAAGACVALSLLVGLEAVPQLAALLVVPFALWVLRGGAERRRLLGLGASLCVVTGVAALAFRPTFWSRALCDAFTPASATAALAGGAALVALALATPRLRGVRARALAGGAAGAAVPGSVLLAFPACLAGPYGAMHPFLRAHYLPHIGEVGGVLAQPGLGEAVALGGLMAAGAAGAIWTLARRPRRAAATAPVAAVVLASAAVTLFQARGLYAGAPLTAPVLAGLVLAGRRRGRGRAPAVLAAWAASSGVAWASAGALLQPPPAPPAAGPDPAACKNAATWRGIDRFPPGVAMSAVNHAAYLVGATRHSSVGAGYHRNDRGLLATYRYFLSPPDRAAAVARDWRVDLVAWCPGDFGELRPAHRYPGSVAALLAAGRTPPGLSRLPLRGTAMRLYRVER